MLIFISFGGMPVMFSEKTIGKFIEWAYPSLKKIGITGINIELKRLIDDMVSIDLPYHYNKKFFNAIELKENEEIEIHLSIWFEDGVSSCSIDTSFKNNKYEIKHFIFGNFRGQKFASSYEGTPDDKEIENWVKKTEKAVKHIVALLNDYIKI